jgi:DNA-binding LytR/AlgR family response regulator
LADGRSFEIFRQVEVNAPVIFTTAYDQFALDAFKHNGVDYLLKPIRREELQKALEKVTHSKTKEIDYDKLAEAVERRSKKYIQRFLVRFADQLINLDVDDVLFFQIRDGAVYAQTASGGAFPVDFSLEQLEKNLDPEQFYRINRKAIVAMKGIHKMYAYSRSRVKIEVIKGELLEPVVSTDRSGAFKKWLEDDLSID